MDTDIIKVDPKKLRLLSDTDRTALKQYARGCSKTEFRYANVPEVRRILGLQTKEEALESLPASWGEVDGVLFHECSTCEEYLNKNRDLQRENEVLREALSQALRVIETLPNEGSVQWVIENALAAVRK